MPDILFNPKRTRIISAGEPRRGPVLYWMSREQRANDNHALLHAIDLAREKNVPLFVCFVLVPEFLDATMRQYGFMLRGLEETERILRTHNIPFVLRVGNPPDEVASFAREIDAAVVVTEFDPLRIKREWKRSLTNTLSIPVVEVDGRNVVPAWLASSKREYAAYTIRPKINRQLHDYLDDLPLLPTLKKTSDTDAPAVDWKGARESLSVNNSVAEADWITPGEEAARYALKSFIANTLARYGDERNDPTHDATSRLSPYLHFGQLSAVRVANEVLRSGKPSTHVDAFIEQLVVRRELSDNFCYYTPDYDSPICFPDWAKKTIAIHADDEREYIYTDSQFEKARTHDELWNAAQRQMVNTGFMHNYMRMYWAKKILEWTPNVTEAMRIAIRLNDTYELDGRDPNGYAGIAWSIGGVHDRAWPERPVFGKIRYMNYNGAKSKFNVREYIEKNSENLFDLH